MKKIVLTLSAIMLLIAVSVTKSYADDKIITVQQLPAKAQQFIKKHFADKQVSYTAKDTDLLDGDYKVMFSDGCKVEFNSKGDWEKVDCVGGCVPAAIIPAPIAKYITANYKDVCAKEIKFDKELISSRYKVELQNTMELVFDKQGNFVGIDD